MRDLLLTGNGVAQKGKWVVLPTMSIAELGICGRQVKDP